MGRSLGDKRGDCVMSVFIFGAGYSGKAIARELAGEASFIGGTTRTTENYSALQAAGIEPYAFSGQSDETANLPLAGTTHMVVSIAPGKDGDPLLSETMRQVFDDMPALKWIGYLSTVGVYGDHQGEWVNEETTCRAVSARSIARAEAEDAWLALGRKMNVPVATLRLSGIYGPGRNAFINLEAGRARRLIKPGQVFNRIHVDDIAGAVAHLARARTGGIFNVTDDQPAPPQNVVLRAAEIMGVQAPSEHAFKTAELTPMVRSFYGENKRVSNARLKQAGYVFRHADFNAGLLNLWETGNWRG